ncbi:putative amino-acid transporter [Sulfolobus islandicus rod-shaped virus]|nr:putative amino-acid transporter [Sulfolobus islandicus rod-shaped virus]
MEFQRKSSGIIKSFNSLDIFSINLLYMGILSGISYPLFVSEMMKNVNLLFAILIGSAFGIPLLVMYYVLTKKIPLNGGDYAYIRSTFSPKFYTIFGISLWLIYVFSAPVLSDLVLLNFNIPTIEKFFISELLFAIALLSIVKKSIYAYIVDGLAILQIIVSLILPISSFHFEFENFTVSNTLLSALLFDLAMFLFLNAISYIAGETKNVNRSMKIGYFVSYLVVTVLAILDSYSNLNILFILMPIWFMSYIFVTSMIQSRLVQNLAFDKILPEKFTKITPNALLLIFTADTITNILENLLNFSISFGFDGLLFIFWNFIVVSFAFLKLTNKKLLFSVVLISLALQIFLFFYLGMQNQIFYSFVIEGNILYTILRILIMPILGGIIYLLRRKVINVE